jgi:hypothetical protein
MHRISRDTLQQQNRRLIVALISVWGLLFVAALCLIVLR